MREILFRGKRVDDNEWVYGYLYIHNGYSGTSALIRGDKILDTEVDIKTIGQYTGLTDKNGKKIFEGDICKGNEYSDENEIFVIKYGKYKTSDWKEKYISNTYQFGWHGEYINSKEQVCLVSPNGIRIIGNIYDKEVK